MDKKNLSVGKINSVNEISTQNVLSKKDNKVDNKENDNLNCNEDSEEDSGDSLGLDDD